MRLGEFTTYILEPGRRRVYTGKLYRSLVEGLLAVAPQLRTTNPAIVPKHDVKVCFVAGHSDHRANEWDPCCQRFRLPVILSPRKQQPQEAVCSSNSTEDVGIVDCHCVL